MARSQVLRGMIQLPAAIGFIVLIGVILGGQGAESWQIGALMCWLALVVILFEALFLRADSVPRIGAWALVALGGIMMREDLDEMSWAFPAAFGAVAAVLILAAVYGRRPLAARDTAGRPEGRPGAERDNAGPRRRPGKPRPSRPGDEGTRPPDHRTVT